MTTVALDAGGIMAADTGSITGTLKSGKNATQKVMRIGDTCYGYAGEAAQCLAVIHYLSGQTNDKPRFLNKADFSIMAVKDGKALIYVEDFYPYAADPPVAIGSGADIATTAMFLGHSAVDAVRAAIKLDLYSSGRVQQLKT